MAEEWTLGQGFRSASKQETDTDGQQVGEVPYHGESLAGGKGPGWSQSKTPNRRVGIKLSTNVNGFGPSGTQSVLDLSSEDTARPLGHSDKP